MELNVIATLTELRRGYGLTPGRIREVGQPLLDALDTSDADKVRKIIGDAIESMGRVRHALVLAASYGLDADDAVTSLATRQKRMAKKYGISVDTVKRDEDRAINELHRLLFFQGRRLPPVPSGARLVGSGTVRPSDAPQEYELLTSSKLHNIDERSNRYGGQIFRVEPTGIGRAMGDSYIVDHDSGLPIAAGTIPGDTLRFQVAARDSRDRNETFYVHRIHCDGELADLIHDQGLTFGIGELNESLQGSTFFLECRGTYGEMTTGFVDDDTSGKEFATIWRLVDILMQEESGGDP
jgi:hypothetical protein